MPGVFNYLRHMNYLIESYSNPVTNALSLCPFYRREEWGPKRAINPKLTQMRLESRFLWLQVQAFNHWILQVPCGKLLGLSHSAWFASRAWPALEFIPCKWNCLLLQAFCPSFPTRLTLLCRLLHTGYSGSTLHTLPQFNLYHNLIFLPLHFTDKQCELQEVW